MERNVSNIVRLLYVRARSFLKEFQSQLKELHPEDFRHIAQSRNFIPTVLIVIAGEPRPHGPEHRAQVVEGWSGLQRPTDGHRGRHAAGRCRDALNAKGNFRFEREIRHWRSGNVLDVRHKK